jgi:hypothetical protein
MSSGNYKGIASQQQNISSELCRSAGQQEEEIQAEKRTSGEFRIGTNRSRNGQEVTKIAPFIDRILLFT